MAGRQRTWALHALRNRAPPVPMSNALPKMGQPGTNGGGAPAVGRGCELRHAHQMQQDARTRAMASAAPTSTPNI